MAAFLTDSQYASVGRYFVPEEKIGPTETSTVFTYVPYGSAGTYVSAGSHCRLYANYRIAEGDQSPVNAGVDSRDVPCFAEISYSRADSTLSDLLVGLRFPEFSSTWSTDASKRERNVYIRVSYEFEFATSTVHAVSDVSELEVAGRFTAGVGTVVQETAPQKLRYPDLGCRVACSYLCRIPASNSGSSFTFTLKWQDTKCALKPGSSRSECYKYRVNLTADMAVHDVTCAFTPSRSPLAESFELLP